jgi:hypothetical protein
VGFLFCGKSFLQREKFRGKENRGKEFLAVKKEDRQKEDSHDHLDETARHTPGDR